MTNKTDSMVNVATRLNTKLDKQTQVQIQRNILTQQQIEALYQSCAMSRKIVDRVVNEGCRKWIDIQNIDPQTKLAFNNFLNQINAKNAIREVWRYSRLYGGGAILINVDDGLELSDPININQIKQIKSLIPLSRYSLYRQSEVISDIDSKYFGEPEFYTLTDANTAKYITKIHHTRLIKIQGEFLPDDLYQFNNYWGDSVLSSMYDSIRNYNQAHDMVSSIMQDFRERILKIQGLSDILGLPDGQDLLTKRVNAQDFIRSALKTNVIDSSDDMSIVTTNLSNVSDILDRIDSRLVASTNLPHTIVLGDSPVGGLNNSGQNENRDWYDYVSDQQEDKIRQPIQRILELLMYAKNGPTNGKYDPEITFIFTPLWQKSERDQAEIEKIVAEKDAIYYNINVLTENEIANNRYGGGHFSMDTKLDDVERDDMTIEPEPDGEE